MKLAVFGSVVVIGLVLALFVEPSGHPHLSASRSPDWPKVRAAHLKLHPVCEACGAHGKSASLEVHHVVPFSDDPSKEKDPTNLITLCSEGGLDCHFWAGHAGNYKCSNPNVREDAKKIRAAINAERERIKKARKCD
jgi:5-methylcytosine-specific restriction protein A